MPQPAYVGMSDPHHGTGGVDRKPVVDIDNFEGIFWIAALPLGANCVFAKTTIFFFRLVLPVASRL